MSWDIAVSADANVRAVLTPGKLNLTRNGRQILDVANNGQVRAMALSPDNKWLAAGGMTTRVWSAETGKPAWTQAGGVITAKSFDASSQRLIIAGAGTVMAREAATGNVLWEAPVMSTSEGMVTCSPDGKLAACRLTPLNIDLLETATGRRLARLEHPVAKVVQHMAFSPDGSLLSVSCGGHSVQIWNLKELRRQLKELQLDWADAE
jgi:WD40 repeat protein